MIPTGSHWHDLLDEVRRNASPLSGLYHHNYTAHHGGQKYVIRVRRSLDWVDLEPRMFGEASTLSAVEDCGVPAPRLVYAAGDASFSVITHVAGRPIASFYQAGHGLPSGLADFVGDAMRRLSAVRLEQLVPLSPPGPLASAENSSAFLAGLLTWLRDLVGTLSEVERAFLSSVGVSLEVLGDADASSTAGQRNLRLCHGDLQPSNFFVTDSGNYALLDWEMSAWADPFWDVASFMHRFGVHEDEAERKVGQLLAACPEWTGSREDWEILQLYLAIERYRSAIIDAARIIRMGSEWDELHRDGASREYHAKLAAAEISAPGERAVRSAFAEAWQSGDP